MPLSILAHDPVEVSDKPDHEHYPNRNPDQIHPRTIANGSVSPVRADDQGSANRRPPRASCGKMRLMLTGLLPALVMFQGQLVATTPAERLNEGWWKERHERCVEMTRKGGIDVVFLGDSITQGWEGQKAWDRDLAPLKAGNFGFSGDRTEHVLWRLEHGEILGLNPKAIVIMIGTNNVGHGSSNSEQAAQGVGAIVKKLREGLPNAKILLLGVFPRGEQPNDPLRLAVGDITKRISALNDGKHVFFKDIGPAFVRIDGTLRTLLMPDRLHLNEAGYEIWAKAILPDLKALLK